LHLGGGGFPELDSQQIGHLGVDDAELVFCLEAKPPE